MIDLKSSRGTTFSTTRVPVRIKKDNTAVLFLFSFHFIWICSIDDTRLTALSATYVTPLALSSNAVEMSFSPVVIALIVSRISPVFLENSLLPIAAPFPV